MDNSTQKRILMAGKAEFLAKGFENASLRLIAKNAGVTTGAIYGYFHDKAALFDALVAEPASHLLDWYLSVQKTFDDYTAQYKQQHMHSYTNDNMLLSVDYIYEHYDAFKLLLCCSAGTKYEHYIDDLVDIEVEFTQKFIQSLRSLGHEIKELDKDMIHIISNALYYGLFEFVAHDMPKEKALKHAKKLYEFYSAGWDAILGL